MEFMLFEDAVRAYKISTIVDSWVLASLLAMAARAYEISTIVDTWRSHTSLLFALVNNNAVKNSHEV